MPFLRAWLGAASVSTRASQASATTRRADDGERFVFKRGRVGGAWEGPHARGSGTYARSGRWCSASNPERGLEPRLAGPADGYGSPVREHGHLAALAPRLQAGDARHVEQVGAMDASKVARIETRLQALQRL